MAMTRSNNNFYEGPLRNFSVIKARSQTTLACSSPGTYGVDAPTPKYAYVESHLRPMRHVPPLLDACK